MLGVHGKLVKYVIHLSKRKKIENNNFFSHKVPKQQSTSFWFQGILGVNPQIISQSHSSKVQSLFYNVSNAYFGEIIKP